MDLGGSGMEIESIQNLLFIIWGNDKILLSLPYKFSRLKDALQIIIKTNTTTDLFVAK